MAYQSTEDRIAEIAQGFTQGLGGLQQGMNSAQQIKNTGLNQAIQLKQQELAQEAAARQVAHQASLLKLQQDEFALKKEGAKADTGYKLAQTRELNLPFDQTRDFQKAMAIQELKNKGKTGGTPKQNEFQAAGFAKRARLAMGDLAKLPEDVGTGSMSGMLDAKIPFTNAGIVPESWKTDTRKGYEQAQRNFVSAVLRKESGAAISPEEYENEGKKYFPQPGDGKENLAQKARSREQAVLNLEGEGKRALAHIGDVPTDAVDPKLAQAPGRITDNLASNKALPPKILGVDTHHIAQLPVENLEQMLQELKQKKAQMGGANSSNVGQTR